MKSIYHLIIYLVVFSSLAHAQYNPQPNWKDSYAVGGKCYCDSSYDHNLDQKTFATPVGIKTIPQICADIKRVLGEGPTQGRIPYNDIQCGNGPPNDAPDEPACPGRVDIGSAGCSQIGPKWDLASVYGATTIQNAEQYDMSGNWYEPETNGQGLVIEMYTRQALNRATPYLFAGWFTYTDTVGGTDQQTWYTLESDGGSDNRKFNLIIAKTPAGKFDTTPTVKPTVVGRASITFNTCSDAVLDYTFDAANGGKTGQVKLTRLLNNVSCENDAPVSNAPRDFLNSGAWYEPETAGQGLFFEVNPSQKFLFGAWYTYTATGNAGHRWFTLQQSGVDTSTGNFANVPIYETTRGQFDAPGQTQLRQVGQASITFTSCSQAQINYQFTVGDLQGRSGTIALQRVGPKPTEC